VPDGTFIPSGVGEPGAPSDLFEFLDGIYGDTATWQQIYHDMFDRWSELSGLTYVFEPNDDGVDLFSAPGDEGVRGDLRLAGKFIDGNSGTLAYNFFPQNGDMVIDTGDSFYTNTFADSIRLRNVLSHEHGHGMGQLHVCPIEGNKLMEPFINTGFNGPQHDDIRNAQRFYGDAFEPDNSAAAASPLGSIAVGDSVLTGPAPPPFVSFGSVLSIDTTNEQDWFSIDIAEGLTLDASAIPIGLFYNDDSQSCPGASGSCCSTTTTDSRNRANLIVEIYDADGATPLGEASSAPAGSTETASAYLPGAGTYFVRVSAEGFVAETQLYHLDLVATPAPAIAILAPNGPAVSIDPNAGASFDVQISAVADVVLPGSEVLRYRYDGGAYLSAPLTPLGGDDYAAVLPPAPCDAVPEYYVEAEGQSSGSVVTLPAAGPAAPFTAIVGSFDVLIDLDFELDPAFGVSSDPSLTAGEWERGVPVNASRGDPNADFDGSGQCWLTQNDLGPQGDGNSDVDGGATTLTSDLYDVSQLTDPVVSYARWFSNDVGSNPETNTMVVEVSDNGGASWVTLEVVGPTSSDANPEVSGGWFERSFLITDFVSLTSQFQIRWTVADDTGSVVEAGVDALSIVGRACEQAPDFEGVCCFGCDPAPTPGACPDASGTVGAPCADADEADCLAAGGTFRPGLTCADAVDPCQCLGDLNGDGETNVFDFTELAGNFGLSGPSCATRAQGDLNCDGVVNVFDFTELSANFGCVSD
jgi:hypothetical protein